MVTGEIGGAAHLLPAAAIALLAILAWWRPLEGGIAMLAAAALVAIPFIRTAAATPDEGILSPGLLIMVSPQLLAGALFLASGLLSHRSAGTAAAAGV